MTQWLRKKIITLMGNIYVWLDKGLHHETSPILGLVIDLDFQNMARLLEICKVKKNEF